MTGTDPNRNCLHLVAGSSTDAIARCRVQFEDGDTVLFIDDGVMCFAGGPGTFSGLDLKDCRFSVTDLEARGLLQAAQKAPVITFQDPDFSELLRNHACCVTWK